MSLEDDKLTYYPFLYFVRLPFSIITVVFCLVLLIPYIVNKEQRGNLSGKLKILILLNGFIQGLFFLPHYEYANEYKDFKNETFCRLQGTIIFTLYYYNLILITVYGILSFVSFSESGYIEQQDRFKNKIAVIAIILVGIIMILIVFLVGWKGHIIIPGVTCNCWPENKSMRKVNFLVFIVLASTNCTFLIILMVKIVKRLKTTLSKPVLRTILFRIICFFLVQIIWYFPFFLDGIRRFIKNLNLKLLSWYVIRDIIETSCGFVFALTYCYNVEVSQTLKRIFLCKKEDPNEGDGLTEGEPLDLSQTPQYSKI